MTTAMTTKTSLLNKDLRRYDYFAIFFILFAFYNVGGARSPLTGVRAAELNAGNENIYGYRYIIEIK